MQQKNKALSIRFYALLLLFPFLIAIGILLVFLHVNFNSIEEKSNYITDNMVPDFIETQGLLQKLQDLQHSLELIRFSNDFNLVDSAYASSRRLNSDYCAPYEKEIIGFKTRIGAVYDVRMEVLSLRKYLFDKVQYVNELGQDIDFYKKILIAPASLLDKQADYKILKVFSKNYTELKTRCLSKEGNESNTLSYCDALLPAYTDLEKNLDKLYAKRQQLDEEYKLISQDIKDFGQTLSGKHNYSLIKDIFEIEDNVGTVRHMVRAVIVIAVVMVLVELFLIHFFIVSPIYKIAKEIREFHRTKQPIQVMSSSKIGEIQDIYSLLNPLFKDVSAVYSESFELQKQNKDLKNLALIDDLTQLLNRRALNLLIREKPFAKKGMAVCMMDIDYFKCLNDSMGHIEGDKVLHKVAAVLKEKVANGDLIYRYGGEEFCIILFDVKQEDVIKIACRLCKEIENLNLLNKGRNYKPVTISAGTSLIAQDDKYETLIDLIHQADDALYRAKNCGRNCAVSYEEVLKL